MKCVSKKCLRNKNKVLPLTWRGRCLVGVREFSLFLSFLVAVTTHLIRSSLEKKGLFEHCLMFNGMY